MCFFWFKHAYEEGNGIQYTYWINVPLLIGSISVESHRGINNSKLGLMKCNKRCAWIYDKAIRWKVRVLPNWLFNSHWELKRLVSGRYISLVTGIKHMVRLHANLLKLDGKHIQPIPNLLFKRRNICWRIWFR